ncbi:MAG: hypothetical protein JEZ00_17240 [Anaerolineaceae bacterium]|nr:hypothetical protein [Anaerolineaceae bacterium]
MIYEKLVQIISHYINKELSMDEILAFKNQFEVIYSNFTNELEKEIEIEKYEILDSIYMHFDSNEPNEQIRENDQYCIDENELIDNIKDTYNKLV